MLNSIKKWLGLDYYVSPLDRFLKKYDKTHPKLSLSQRMEKNKYDRIFCLRDQPQSSSASKPFWDNF